METVVHVLGWCVMMLDRQTEGTLRRGVGVDSADPGCTEREQTMMMMMMMLCRCGLVWVRMCEGLTPLTTRLLDLGRRQAGGGCVCVSVTVRERER